MAETKTNIPVEIKMGNAGADDANLPAFKEGSIIFTKDTKKIYIDPVGETERIAVGGEEVDLSGKQDVFSVVEGKKVEDNVTIVFKDFKYFDKTLKEFIKPSKSTDSVQIQLPKDAMNILGGIKQIHNGEIGKSTVEVVLGNGVISLIGVAGRRVDISNVGKLTAAEIVTDKLSSYSNTLLINRAGTGAPVQIAGVADGAGQNEAVNKKQLDAKPGKAYGTSEVFNDYTNNKTYKYKGVKVTNVTSTTNSSTFTLESVAGLAAGGTFNIAYKSDNNSGISLYSTQFTIASVDTTNKTITTTTEYSGPPTSIYLLYVVNSTATDATPLYAVCAHAEGQKTKAIGICDHAEGLSTQATGGCSHAEGSQTKATGDSSHAEGLSTTASGSYSHAQNFYTRAGYADQTAMGTNNINKSDTLLEVGNGSIQTASNAFEVYRDGHAEVQKMGTTDNSVAIKKYVDTQVSGLIPSIFEFQGTPTTNPDIRFNHDTSESIPGGFRLIGASGTGISFDGYYANNMLGYRISSYGPNPLLLSSDIKKAPEATIADDNDITTKKYVDDAIGNINSILATMFNDVSIQSDEEPTDEEVIA